MRISRASQTLPIPVGRVLRKLGRDIREARLRRRIPTAIVAQRASISRMTLFKIERGDPGVAMGLYATVLFVLGLSGHLADIAASHRDAAGLQLEAERLPQRIRLARTQKRVASE
jgi:DNA-binding XRE family transcriptional regulator